MSPIPPARAGTEKSRPLRAAPAVGHSDGSVPPETAPSMLVPAEMAAVVVPAYATMPAATAVPAPALAVSTLAAMPAPASAVSTLAAVFSLDRAGDRNRQSHRSNDEQF